MSKHPDKFCERCRSLIAHAVGRDYKSARFCGAACYHAAKKFTAKTREAAFWNRVEKREDGCWIFLGCKDKWGYGHMSVSSGRHQAHRYSYELANGPIPSGKIILHSCDVRACVNPAHMRTGTDADNVADMRARGRDHFATKAKLTAEQVLQIRALKGTATHREIAARFGIGASAIGAIFRGRSWRAL